MRKSIVSLVTAAALVGSLGFGMSASAEEVTVNKGDTLWSIANNKNIQLDELKEWNSLSSNLIFPGDRLQVSRPGKEKAESTNEQEKYTIKRGDTLTSIARKFDGVTTSQIQEWNQISNPNIIIAGQTLTINGSAKEATQTSEQTQKTETSPTSNNSNTNEDVAQELTMTATAYTASCNGCSGITATGLNLIDNPDKKVISVDPSVIPLGSKVYVEGYGHAIAGDTGGAIKGNKIDLFIPNQQDAINWGVQEVNVKVYH
ncbi:LysM peptidoglycan-binding and 3D domain-containing protein [Halalkalibacter flavus]|uniref:LysM peptidoglycan-binding and 3D domain-containing protein n=1 Tax=Halalkalibacter flavus TaxID=3090668 RepID=UPI002FC8DDBD